MSATTIAFFNNKGGVGKTSLAYHLACMYAEFDLQVVAADLDPQANLTAAFLRDERLEDLWPEKGDRLTVFGCLRPLSRGTGDIGEPYSERVGNNLVLLAGDMALSSFEDELSAVWPKCLDGDERAFRVISALWRIIQKMGEKHEADIILVDLGPNLGAINRAALIAADYLVIPLSPDLFSLQGLRNLGPTLRKWRHEWEERLEKNPAVDLALPKGTMQPAGYIVLQHSVRLDRPVKAYERWIAQIPIVYREAVLDESGGSGINVADDEHCLSLLKHYRSLMPLAQEAHKPIFALKPADGAIGAHLGAVHAAYKDFEKLALEIARQTNVKVPPLI